MNFTGQNMTGIKVRTSNEHEELATIDSDGATAAWIGNVAAPTTVLISRRILHDDAIWFLLDVSSVTP